MDLDGYAPIARLVTERTGSTRPVLVGIAGGVAAGKSTAAAILAQLLVGQTVAIVSTDGFLLPTAELMARDLIMRKGFPESYDVDALEGFLDAARAGVPGLTVPIYSHETYDIVPDRRESVGTPDVLVVEGVNALQFAERLDLAIYLDAAEADLETWYMARLHEVCAAPPPGSFYAQFRGFSPRELDTFGREVWRSINLVNLRDCIEPTRACAHVVVNKRADHSVVSLDMNAGS